MALQPDFGPNAVLPPLPIIFSDAIRLQVFTHRSFFARPTHIFEDQPDDLSPDNEKFEHLGDTVLGLVVTGLMLDMYPGLRVGPSTKIRALIVGNATLATISVMYRLPDHLRLHPAQAITLRASTNVQADVFESFVGGLYIDQGLETVKQWLSRLFRPYVTCAYRIVRAQHGLPPLPGPRPTALISPPGLTEVYPGPDSPSSSSSQSGDSLPVTPLETTIGHLALFNQHLQKANREVEWVYSDGDAFSAAGETNGVNAVLGGLRGTRTTPVWLVRVMVDGEYFGKGRGNTKKLARNDAAKEGLKKLGIFVWLDMLDGGDQHGFSRLGLDGEGSLSSSGVQRLCMGNRSVFVRRTWGKWMVGFKSRRIRV